MCQVQDKSRPLCGSASMQRSKREKMEMEMQNQNAFAFAFASESGSLCLYAPFFSYDPRSNAGCSFSGDWVVV